jgi:uncharacterized protein (DUF885 family)
VHRAFRAGRFREASLDTIDRDGNEASMTDSTVAAQELVERYWEGLLEIEPILGTWVGDERYDDRLPDPGEDGVARRKDFHDAALADLASIDRHDLDVEMRISLDVLETGSRRELSSIEHRIDRFHAVTHLFGPGNLLAELGSLQRADSSQRLDRYVARLGAIPAYLQAIGQVALEATKVGQVSPSLVVDRSIHQVERLLGLDPSQSPAMGPVTGQETAGRERVVAVLREKVWPAYHGYLETLRAYRPSARDSIGLSALPGGDAIYAAQMESYTSLALDPQAVHDTGKEQLAQSLKGRRESAQRLGYDDAEVAISEYTATGANTAKSREDMLRVVREQVERSWEAAPRYFGRLPRANCEVRPVEEFREQDMPGAYYNSPTEDGSRPGIYYVNTGGLDQRPLHQTATTSFHEANPGHHFQLSIEQEFTDRPLLRRFGGFLVGAALPEGWGLYSELLADEMSLFLNEYERIGMFEAQGLRACRLIVDTGIHALGWDRERAVRQMQEAGTSRQDSEIEVDRYIADPGQALAYMIGRLEIQRWRAELEKREGSEFSLQQFHDRVLALGSLPLKALERELLDGTA